MNFRTINKEIGSIKNMLHRVNSSCGRPLVSFMFGLIVLGCASSNEDINPMESYYIESQNLVNTTIDSTKNFAYKYNSYVFSTPGAQDDVHYQPTLSNICAALDTFGYLLIAWNLNATIIVDYRWEEDTTIYY